MFFSLFFLIFMIFILIYLVITWIILYHIKKYRIKTDKAYPYFIIAFLFGSFILIGWGAFSLFQIYITS